MIPLFNFYLKDIHSTSPTCIYLQSKYNYTERLMLTTSERILPAHWDFINKRALVKYNKFEYPLINDWLDKMEMSAKDYFRNCKFQGQIPSAAEIKAHLEEKFKLNVKPEIITPKVAPLTVLGFIDKFIQNSKTDKSEGTIKVYNTGRKHLVDFIKLQGKIDIGFDYIDEDFYNHFVQHLNSIGFAKNTVGKQIKVLKTFLNAGTERGINKNMFYKCKIFRRVSEDVDKIYLMDSEIQRIYGLDLSDNKSLESTRDLFVIACYTGLRFSDFSTLRKEHISENYITKTTMKTRAKVIVPLHPIVREILKRNGNDIPKAYTNAHANSHLKEIAQMANLNTDVEIVKTIGGKIVKQLFKKWELVTTHTGRRSFATNCYLAGLPAISIMKLTSHKSEAVFLKYICVSELENAEHIQGHAFFNTSNFKEVA